MRKNFRLLTSTILFRIGSIAPTTVLKISNKIYCLINLGNWLKKHSSNKEFQYFSRRERIFDKIASEVGNKPVTYLEFGVYQGEATRYWSQLLTHPESILHGFDSFEGLPEDWATHKKTHFSTNGQIPEINDKRVTFFKGWFEDTLKNYKPTLKEQLIINLDADLYSSTKTVLNNLEDYIVAGTYLYFDEFASNGNEEKAFREFIEKTDRQFRVIGATKDWGQVAFQII